MLLSVDDSEVMLEQGGLVPLTPELSIKGKKM